MLAHPQVVENAYVWTLLQSHHGPLLLKQGVTMVSTIEKRNIFVVVAEADGVKLGF